MPSQFKRTPLRRSRRLRGRSSVRIFNYSGRILRRTYYWFSTIGEQTTYLIDEHSRTVGWNRLVTRHSPRFPFSYLIDSHRIQHQDILNNQLNNIHNTNSNSSL